MGASGAILPVPNGQNYGFDTTGQVAPQGMKPRVTATLWEDEGSLCFQVEARGICVARREGENVFDRVR
jgi:enhanced filamentous growth protein 1